MQPRNCIDLLSLIVKESERRCIIQSFHRDSVVLLQPPKMLGYRIQICLHLRQQRTKQHLHQAKTKFHRLSHSKIPTIFDRNPMVQECCQILHRYQMELNSRGNQDHHSNHGLPIPTS